ncbi:MAG: hypothetical protein ACRDTV_09745 [Mycobacterium sp.]
MVSPSMDRSKPDDRRTPHTPDSRNSAFNAAEPTERLIVGQSSGRKTRRTVDLTAVQHRALDLWQREAADRLGFARVTGQEVLSALVDQLLNDRELAARITRTIQARR